MTAFTVGLLFGLGIGAWGGWVFGWARGFDQGSARGRQFVRDAFTGFKKPEAP